MVNDYKLHCPLSSRMLGQYYLQGKKKRKKKKRSGLRYFMDYSLLDDVHLEIMIS